jgi:hypothetical protein
MILPLCHDVQLKRRKRFLKGLGGNALDRERFKCACLDANWRSA